MSLNKFTIQKSFAISAGAGSGKTYTLSRRYLNALLGFDFFRENSKDPNFIEELKSAEVDQIVTMTYTEAAALEMKERIFVLVVKVLNVDHLDDGDGDKESIIEALSQLNDEQKSYITTTLQRAMKSSGDARISTIHAYCLGIIKKHADIAKLDSNAEIIKEDEKANIIGDTIFSVLNDPANKSVVLELSESINMFFFDALIKKYLGDTKFRTNFDAFDVNSIDRALYKDLIRELHPLPDRCEIDEDELDEVRIQWLDDFIVRYDEFDAVMWTNVHEDKTPSLGAKKYPTVELFKKAYESKISAYSLIDDSKENHFFELIEKVKSILQQIKASYDGKLLENKKLDFDTIISKTLELMPKVKSDIKYFMVDEFQDTNASQYEIVKASCNSNTNLFVVGDSKQSIYSFQGAEIEVFNDAINDRGRFTSVEEMSTNHRSDGIVLDRVNAIFANLLVKDEHLELIKQNYEASAQALEVFKEKRREKGTFKFLITPQTYDDKKDEESDISEYATIAKFIENISAGTNVEYAHIKELIDQKKKAIAIVFDAKSKMLELKAYMDSHGIECKVSASENFYHTKEFSDIFHLLKAIEIIARKNQNYTPKDYFYIAGTMRSNILRISDNAIKEYLDTKTLPEKLIDYANKSKETTLAQLVKYIYDDARIIDVYAHLSDVDQRVANLHKFLELALEYETHQGDNLYAFVTLLERAVYFSDVAEDEAFYKSDNVESIELCTIHSTKGLAYPMVILANSQKGVYSQIQSDSIRHNNFTLATGEQKEIAGFKVQGYEPLSLRVLKGIDKLKHLAEKKRLLYVALTRSMHDVVISARLDEKVDGGISLKEDSYLYMIASSLSVLKNGGSEAISDVFKQELFTMSGTFDYINKLHETAASKSASKITPIKYEFESIVFDSKVIQRSATQSDGEEYVNARAVALGTSVHKLIEFHWNSMKKGEYEKLLVKENIAEPLDRERVTRALDNFMDSDVYQILKSGAEAYFELPFDDGSKHGFIDLVYYDSDQNGWVIIDFKTGIQNSQKEQGYQGQLDFYQSFLEDKGMTCVDARLLWL